MEPTSITLTRDELLVFLSIVGSSTMIGVEDTLFEGLSDREVTERLNSGEYSLTTRGLMTWRGAEELVLDDALAALVGGSIVPDTSLRLSVTPPSGPARVTYFHASPDLLVEYTSPRAGIHVFTEVPDLTALEERARGLLTPLSEVASDGDDRQVEITASEWAPFIASALDGDVETARLILAAAGCPSLFAKRLAQSYREATEWVGQVAWGLQAPEASGAETVTALVAGDGVWLVTVETAEAEGVRIRHTTGAECEAEFLTLLRPLQRAFAQPAS